MKELRTASLLTTYENKYHVQYHNTELGVHRQDDTTIVPISPSDSHLNLKPAAPVEPEAAPGGSDQKANQENGQSGTLNMTRNQLLASSQLAGNQQLVQVLLNQVDEGTRQHQFINIEQTEYTADNKKAMALLFILVERKDQITSRLSKLEMLQNKLKERISAIQAAMQD